MICTKYKSTSKRINAAAAADDEDDVVADARTLTSLELSIRTNTHTLTCMNYVVYFIRIKRCTRQCEPSLDAQACASASDEPNIFLVENNGPPALQPLCGCGGGGGKGKPGQANMRAMVSCVFRI